jgi:hypothetical protein
VSEKKNQILIFKKKNLNNKNFKLNVNLKEDLFFCFILKYFQAMTQNFKFAHFLLFLR